MVPLVVAALVLPYLAFLLPYLVIPLLLPLVAVVLGVAALRRRELGGAFRAIAWVAVVLDGAIFAVALVFAVVSGAASMR